MQEQLENIICQICFLGLWVIPNAYTLRHARGYGRSALRNWQFQVSKDGVTWTTLYDHLDDQSLNDPGKIFFKKVIKIFFKHLQNFPNF